MSETVDKGPFRRAGDAFGGTLTAAWPGYIRQTHPRPSFSPSRRLLSDITQPLFPYTRPKRKPKGENLYRKTDFVYDEYYDCYLCPQNQVLSYSTTNREGYKEYKSPAKHCRSCPERPHCTHSKNHQKVMTRHVWQEAMEQCEDYRLTPEGKVWYKKRKETIERQFGTAKEHHGFRYTNLLGRAKMQMKAAVTFACLNIKKLAFLLEGREQNGGWIPKMS